MDLIQLKCFLLLVVAVERLHTYNTSLVNLTPFWDTEPNASYSITDSATSLIVTAKAGDSDGDDDALIWQGSTTDSAQYLVDITRDSSVFTFDPLSADSVYDNVTAGNLADSDGGSFIYTFKWSDGINFVSKNVTITYSGLNAWDGTLTSTSVTIGTSGASAGFFVYTSNALSNVEKLLSWRNTLRSGGTTSDANPGGNFQVVFFNGSSPVYGAAIINPYIGGSTTRIFGIDTAWDVTVGKYNNNYALQFHAYGSPWASCVVDGTTYSTSSGFTFDSIKVYNGTNNTVTTSSDSPIAEYTTTLDSNVMVPYTTDLVYYADATNYSKDRGGWYNITGTVNGFGTSSGFGGSGLTIDEEGGSGLNNRAQLNGTTSTTWSPSGLDMTPDSYTLFGVMGYKTSGTEKRILQSANHNWLSGFWSGNAGVAFHGSWITDGSNRQDYHTTNMFYFTDQQDLFRSNGTDRHNASGSTTATIVPRINTGAYPAETSDWRISEILIYSSELSSAQINQVESYLSDKYNIT